MFSYTPRTPRTPPNQTQPDSVHAVTADDLEVLDQITSPDFHPSTLGAKFRRRDNDFDPLILAAAIASADPNLTRHHYLHGEMGMLDLWSCKGGDSGKPRGPGHHYVSKQKPRHERLKEELNAAGATNVSGTAPIPARGLDTAEEELDGTSPENPPSSSVSPRNQRPSPSLPPLSPQPAQTTLEPPHVANATVPHTSLSQPAGHSPESSAANSAIQPHSRDLRPPLVVQCRARTRVPTPHGPVFLHIYHNNWDTKEHLAIVIDTAQLDGESTLPPIRSRSLDAQWEEGEPDMDRIIRGAYIGRLSATRSVPSEPNSIPQRMEASENHPPPLIRIHSECFTGETIGSMRCDCGEQLDEAMRLIAQPQTLPTLHTTIPGRGAVIYLRQEGRGIGLLEKIRAYNLQDLGYDTVTANLMLGHGADERGYEIAAAILRDLGLGGEEEGVRVLTNNPEKMIALEAEGVRVAERVPMVPRSWKCGNDSPSSEGLDDYQLRRAGVTLIGATATHGIELERYLRTKVQRMGHMLDLPTPAYTPAASPGIDSETERASGSI